MKKILITGANGQLGKALAASVPDSYEAIVADRQALNISDAGSVRAWVNDNSPDGIINAAAYTAVDKAETEVELAKAANSDGPKNLAVAAAGIGVPLVHVSTDFVFNGNAGAPYTTDDTSDPLSVYGMTKREGELEVMATHAAQSAIVRTAWVYDASGNNFVTTMLRLMKEKDSLGVVADQIGTPTYVHGLAEACWTLLNKELTGIFHWTDAGVASWYDFAVAIQEEALELGILSKSIPISPLTTADYPTPAVRPSNSLLDKTDTWQALGITAPHWRDNLRKALVTLK